MIVRKGSRIRQHRYIVLWLALLVALFAVSMNTAQAQWTAVAPNLLGPLSIQSGVLTTKSGLVWAANTKLYMSKDFGTTWSLRSPTLYTNDNISDVCFYDNMLGLVGTRQGYVYITRDQGVTWSQLYHPQGASGVCFLGSPNSILITEAAGSVEISTDQGSSWKSLQFGVYTPYAVPLLGGGALVLAGSNTKGLTINSTTDYGATWQQKAGRIDGDCWSFAVDPCNPKHIYVANEEGSVVNNGKAELYVSSDGGDTWNVTFSQQRLYLSGSVTVASNAIYAQTVKNGILRSTDLGATWKNVGGPSSAAFDTRAVLALDDNLLLAADGNGTIYRSINGGTDSVHGPLHTRTLTFSPTTLFTSDTLYSCDPPVTDTINYEAYFCTPLHVLRQWISGGDSNSYALLEQAPSVLDGTGRLRVEFAPKGPGDYRSTLKLLLEDSTVISFPLYGTRIGTVTVGLETANAVTDTIGASLTIPVKVTKVDSTQSFTVVLHYPDTSLLYLGTKSLRGNTIDLSNEMWSGRSKLGITLDTISSDSIIAYAEFWIKAGASRCQTVTIDSLTVPGNLPNCALNLNGPLTATLCFPEGCGVQIITDFMQSGHVTALRIQPNPAHNAVTISSDSSAIVSLQVIDRNGVVRLNKTGLADQTIHLNIEGFLNGLYFLRARTAHGEEIVQQILVTK